MSTLPDTALLLASALDDFNEVLSRHHNQLATLFSTHNSLNPQGPLNPDLAQSLSSLSIATTAIHDASRCLHRFATREAILNPHSL